MAYYKPNLYSLKKQEMLNNIAANSNQCNPNSSGENNCGVGNMSLGVPIPGMPGCGYTGVSGCHTNSLNDGPPSGENGGCRPNPANQGCAAHIQTSGCASHHLPPGCTTSANSTHPMVTGFNTNYNQAMAGCGYSGVSGCHTNSLNDSPPDSGCRPNPSNNGGGCGPIHIVPSMSGIGINDDAVSIDLDPYTNEIKITAGSSYPIEQLAELCRELYT